MHVKYFAKTGHAHWYQGSGGVDLSTHTGKINSFYTLFRKISLDGAFQVDDVQVLVSRVLKIRIFCQ
jgi:hypothetical protein